MPCGGCWSFFYGSSDFPFFSLLHRCFIKGPNQEQTFKSRGCVYVSIHPAKYSTLQSTMGLITTYNNTQLGIQRITSYEVYLGFGLVAAACTLQSANLWLELEHRKILSCASFASCVSLCCHLKPNLKMITTIKNTRYLLIKKYIIFYFFYTFLYF